MQSEESVRKNRSNGNVGAGIGFIFLQLCSLNGIYVLFIEQVLIVIDTYERGRPWNRKQWTCFGSDVEPAVGQSVSILCAKYIATGKLLCEISLEKLAESYSQ